MGELGTITESRYKLKDNTSRVELAPGCTMSMREFVEECYLEPGRENASRAANEGWWEGILDRIAVREVLEAIRNTKKSTAPGPSMVGIDMLKQLGEGHLEEVCEFLNQCLTEGRIPDNMNTAHIRLLPKTEAGFQMDKTRPIVLMETLAKLHERIIITRITRTLDKKPGARPQPVRSHAPSRSRISTANSSRGPTGRESVRFRAVPSVPRP